MMRWLLPPQLTNWNGGRIDLLYFFVCLLSLLAEPNE